MKLGDEFRDFAPLDPRRNEIRWERMVGRVMDAAGPELRLRAKQEMRVLTVLSGWARPALSSTAVVAAAALAILALEISPEATQTAGASALGYPATVTEWMESEVPPSLEELLVSIEGELR